ncbi:N-acetylneuraminate lyase isoform X3 [Myotis lucifugus]|uniref:N-acetylneuraminate lyase isoform X3 n=1 Tax=Myotis lucifugus TaxID=59463 RepID=UPI000CCC6248|nr:N-acetylneuraminate lyase isoform X3 [Myotis lucifugus]
MEEAELVLTMCLALLEVIIQLQPEHFIQSTRKSSIFHWTQLNGLPEEEPSRSGCCNHHADDRAWRNQPFSHWSVRGLSCGKTGSEEYFCEWHHRRRPVSEHLRAPPGRRGVGDKRKEQVGSSGNSCRSPELEGVPRTGQTCSRNRGRWHRCYCTFLSQATEQRKESTTSNEVICRHCNDLTAFLKEVAAAAPALPFYYYHIPALTGVKIRAEELLDGIQEKIPTFQGLKFSDTDLLDFGQCVDQNRQRQFAFLFGVDEQLLSALVMGATGAVGSTYNYLGKKTNQMLEAYERKDFSSALNDQVLECHRPKPS